MDLSAFETSDDVSIMEVYHPVTNEIVAGASIHVLSLDCPKYRELAKERTAKRRFKAGKNASPGAFTLEEARKQVDELETSLLETFALAVVKWEGLDDGGKALPTDVDGIMTTFLRFPWLYQQVSTYVQNRANFMKASS